MRDNLKINLFNAKDLKNKVNIMMEELNKCINNHMPKF